MARRFWNFWPRRGERLGSGTKGGFQASAGGAGERGPRLPVGVRVAGPPVGTWRGRGAGELFPGPALRPVGAYEAIVIVTSLA